MEPINPYQSPHSTDDAPAAGQAGRPSILRCSLFGLYGGAILGATCGGGGMMLLGLLLAAPLRVSPIATAVGGAYFGVIAGGLFGAALGSPLAVATRLHVWPPGWAQALTSAALFTAVMGGLGGWLAWRATRRMAVAVDDLGSVVGEETITRLIALGIAVGAAAGVAAGLLFARRAARFAFPAARGDQEKSA